MNPNMKTKRFILELRHHIFCDKNMLKSHENAEADVPLQAVDSPVARENVK